MIHHLQHISDLVELCHKRGIAHVVASPGSRNAPLIRIFTEHAGFVIHGIVDERSAAYYALGLSLSTGKPIIVLCTSGTAVLNYAPALAEAYYQHIPLIAITADRPEELIDQQDNQTIRQINVYQNFIKSSLHLLRPNLPDYDPGQQNEAIDHLLQMADSGIKGPVHINVPLSEPLYGSVPAPSDEIRINLAAQIETGLSACFKSEWKNSTKRIVLCGQGPFDSRVNMALSMLCDGGKAVVMAESIANVKGNMVLQPVERLFMSLDDEAQEALKPDLLISFGGPVVSKRLKDWLQKQKQLSHFRIAPDHETIDTYQNLKGTIIGEPAALFVQLNDLECDTDHRFVQMWHEQKKQSDQRLSTGLKDAEYSDLMVFHHIVNNLPEDCILHLGNSSPVRYAQLFDLKRCKAVYANRGVSGIDGFLSDRCRLCKSIGRTQCCCIG
jgi:2-succinyl-5-enolpyruvyl-6-hydroxy-3-cyclohexene-1-carboxylate synthase